MQLKVFIDHFSIMLSSESKNDLSLGEAVNKNLAFGI